MFPVSVYPNFPMRGEKGPAEPPLLFKPGLDVEEDSESVSAETGSPGLKQVSRVRTEFPETWLWTETITGYGTAKLSQMLPV